MTVVGLPLERLTATRLGAIRRASLPWLGTAIMVLAVGVPLTFADHLWPFVITGISDGSIYALAAIGLVLTYRTSGVFNFAIGAQAAASGYVFYTLWVTERIPWPVAAIVSLVGVGIVGSLVFERVAYWLGEAPVVMRVAAVIGILVLLQSAITGAYGAPTISIKQFLPQSGVQIGGLQVLGSQIIIVAVALGATAGLYVFFRRARLGAAVQAVVDDPDLLSLFATSPVQVRRSAWMIGSAFVSVSGLLLAPRVGLDVNQMLLLYITSFGAAALGSFSSIPITYVSALGIGIAMNVLSDRLGNSSNYLLSVLYSQVPFLVLVAALVVIPRRKLIERGVRRIRHTKPIVTFPLPVSATAAVGGVALAVALPYLVGSSFIDQYTTGLGFAVIFGSLGLLLWTSGQISLCQMAFAAVGATTFAHAQHAGIGWVGSLVLAVIVAIPVGAIVAIPSFRLTGVYLAVVTFGFGLLFQNLVYRTFLMFGQIDSLTVTRPHLVGAHTATDEGYYYLALVTAGLCALVIVALRRSRLGRLLRGLSDAPVALDAHGANTRLTRMLVFAISAAMAAVGGALIAGVTYSAAGDPSGPFGYFNSLALVAVLAFCRRQPIVSPLLAAFVFEVMKVYHPFNTPFFIKYEGVFFGALAIAVAVGPGLGAVRVSRRGGERTARGRIAARLPRLAGDAGS